MTEGVAAQARMSAVAAPDVLGDWSKQE